MAASPRQFSAVFQIGERVSAVAAAGLLCAAYTHFARSVCFSHPSLPIWPAAGDGSGRIAPFVEELHAPLGQGQLEAEFAAFGRPAVVRGLAADEVASGEWDPAYLSAMYGHRFVDVHSGNVEQGRTDILRVRWPPRWWQRWHAHAQSPRPQFPFSDFLSLIEDAEEVEAFAAGGAAPLRTPHHTGHGGPLIDSRRTPLQMPARSRTWPRRRAWSERQRRFEWRRGACTPTSAWLVRLLRGRSAARGRSAHASPPALLPAAPLLDPQWSFQAVLWIGPAGARTGLHSDVDPMSVLFQANGTKTVWLVPPEEVRGGAGHGPRGLGSSPILRGAARGRRTWCR